MLAERSKTLLPTMSDRSSAGFLISNPRPKSSKCPNKGRSEHEHKCGRNQRERDRKPLPSYPSELHVPIVWKRPPCVTPLQVISIKSVFAFSQMTNVEVRLEWFPLALNNGS